MKTADEGFPPETRAKVSVVVTYEDTATRDRAISVCDGMFAQLGPQTDCEISWWRFSYLHDPALAAQAAAAAAQAGLILFSTHAGAGLPQHVRDWIELWAGHKSTQPSALAALIGMVGDAQQGLTPIHYYLQSVANRAGMDFMPHAAIPLSVALSGGGAIAPKKDEGPVQSLEGFYEPEHPTTHWGLNE
ncbi:MAG TPA: hypothetical protein VGK40_03600 [Verrucomicrobiae bacterium]|jgi:hypothetical protein